MELALCILARGRPEVAAQLIERLRTFKQLEVEVVVGDNSPEKKDREDFVALSDTYLRVEDRDLWYEGFGFVKQQLVKAAGTDWVAIGDLGEVWHENDATWMEGDGIVGSIERHPDVPCWRCMYGEPSLARMFVAGDAPIAVFEGDLCRVFNRKRMQLLGMIHEEPFEKRTARNWSAFARQHGPVAVIEHHQPSASEPYSKRKFALYDHLLDTIYHQPALRTGTNAWWWTTHWPRRLETTGYEPMSFQEWEAMEG